MSLVLKNGIVVPQPDPVCNLGGHSGLVALALGIGDSQGGFLHNFRLHPLLDWATLCTGSHALFMLCAWITVVRSIWGCSWRASGSCSWSRMQQHKQLWTCLDMPILQHWFLTTLALNRLLDAIQGGDCHLLDTGSRYLRYCLPQLSLTRGVCSGFHLWDPGTMSFLSLCLPTGTPLPPPPFPSPPLPPPFFQAWDSWGYVRLWVTLINRFSYLFFVSSLLCSYFYFILLYWWFLIVFSTQNYLCEMGSLINSAK